jgi:hypothetical protein
MHRELTFIRLYFVFQIKIISPLTSILKIGCFYSSVYCTICFKTTNRWAIPNPYYVSAWRLFKHSSNYTLEKQCGGSIHCILQGISLGINKHMNTITEYVRLKRITFQTGDDTNANQTRINALTSYNLTSDNNREINRNRNCLVDR